jgi:hypothetical protein
LENFDLFQVWINQAANNLFLPGLPGVVTKAGYSNYLLAEAQGKKDFSQIGSQRNYSPGTILEFQPTAKIITENSGLRESTGDSQKKSNYKNQTEVCLPFSFI